MPPDHRPYTSSHGSREFACRMLAMAASTLPKEDYVKFLEIEAEMYEQHRISREVVYDALLGIPGKRDFVSVNCDDPHLHRLLDQLVAAGMTSAGAWRDGELYDQWWMLAENESQPPPEMLAWSLPPYAFKHAVQHRVLPVILVFFAMFLFRRRWPRRTFAPF